MRTTYADIIKKIQKKEYAPVYFLTGEEPLYIDKIANYLENNMMTEADRDFNQAVYYAKDTTAEEVVTSAKEFPFGVDKRVVIVKEAQMWQKMDAIKAYAEHPSPSTLLVICYKYTKPSDSVLKFWEKNAVLFVSSKVQDFKLADWVASCAKEHGFTIQPASAELISEHIGNDLSRIDNEFSKLELIIPVGQEITADIIEKFIGINKQYNVFELREALVARDEAKAYKIVHAFSQNLNANPVLVAVASLYKYYNSLIEYHLLPQKNIEEMKTVFGYQKSEKQLAREARIAMGYSLPILIKIIGTLRNIDARCKGIDNAADGEELYKELVYRILH
ncbi:MAG: DNA polymerase III subunit delta [Bacteroidales bacterium]|nr:DNA polymerase III subunit delta [Bacteroidales bacterium]